MPIYEYECQSCHHHFDLMQKMSDKPISLCPNCNEDKATRLVSAAGFQLKGSGWYVTDFRDKKSPAATKSDAPSKKESAASNASSSSAVGSTKGKED